MIIRRIAISLLTTKLLNIVVLLVVLGMAQFTNYKLCTNHQKSGQNKLLMSCIDVTEFSRQKHWTAKRSFLSPFIVYAA